MKNLSFQGTQSDWRASVTMRKQLCCSEDREMKLWGKDGIHVQPCEMENCEMNRLSGTMTTKSKP